MNYESTLRDEQLERTRARILDAAVALLADETLQEMTIPLVARRAGVSVRTVYRHFPVKETLVDAVAARVDGQFGPEPFPPSVDQLRELAPALFASFDVNVDLLRAARSSRAGRAVVGHTRSDRIASARRVLEPLLDGADEEERLRALAVVYSMHSTAQFLYFRDTFVMTAEQAAEATTWVAGLVLDDLERQAAERAAGRRKAAKRVKGKV